MPAPRSKRYESEYFSRYKKFEAKRPVTVKGEVMRSLGNVDSNGASPRAGLLSSQLGTMHEPPLQRKRIVPYEKNHNIFTTVTVKEQPDREWLKPNTDSYRGLEEEKSKRRERRSETPILVAERKIFKDQPRSAGRTVYIPDRIKRKSTYKGDFVNHKKQSKKTNGEKRKSKPKQHQTPQKIVGGNKGGVSPDRLPPAGIRTATSFGDVRLLKPSDDSQYMRLPEPEQKYKTEKNKREKNDWFTQVLERRNQAYGYSKHARGTHFSRESLDEINREHADRASSRSDSYRSYSPSEENSRRREMDRKLRARSSSPPRKREAWSEAPKRFTRKAQEAGTDTESTFDDDNEMVLERGRSPTPELRDRRRSRRHHLDVTTNVLNDSLEKSLSISEKNESHSLPNHDEPLVPLKQEGNGRPESPASSIALGDEASSYTPQRKEQERFPPDPPGARPGPGLGGEEGRKEDEDVLSVSAMSRRASTASETLERAKKRRDKFWKSESYSR
ncbi:PREDICTED: uncharacterized protein LOC107331054 [Acropora digitifera]|uniref:uncharacterized protein LOC107331054 n=1 Tax=Acropora digitifera TaxID=70779 RepID=UPI00077ADACD|nr:PREDICTED: uncharacterized protein LOC107331054 [Acropora digitifera]